MVLPNITILLRELRKPEFKEVSPSRKLIT